tara:strand:- start:143 stop:424 length:282 start_codon:yes stop_codon:yes gene_type:complete
LLSGFATVLVSVPVYAGAWLQKKGECYLKVSYALFKPSTAFDQNGDTVDLNAGDQSSGNYTDISVNTYLEYGPHDKITVIANVPIKQGRGSDR